MLLSLMAGGLLAAGLTADPGAAQDAQDLSSPIGLWQAVDRQTGQPTGWFLIGEQGGVYNGIIAKMFLQPGDDPNVICDKCRDDRHDQPWLGLQIIRGMKPQNTQGKDTQAAQGTQSTQGTNLYGGGTILDPRDGHVYDAEMKLSPDGETLTVRGYLGIALFGRNQYWARLPHSDVNRLAPSIRAQAELNSTVDPPQR